jgi:hypothetical protein
LQVPVDGGLSNNDVATVHGDAQHLRVWQLLQGLGTPGVYPRVYLHLH